MESGNLILGLGIIGIIILGYMYFRSKISNTSSNSSTLSPEQQPHNAIDPIATYKKIIGG